jgi:hypothetical protein
MYRIIINYFHKKKEYLKLLGIKWYIIWITWFLRTLIPYLILSVLITIFTSISLNPRVASDANATFPNTKKAVFQTTQGFVVFSVMFVYSIQCAMFILMLGQMFAKPFVAKIIAILIWILTALGLYSSVSVGGLYFLSLFPNIALQYIIQVNLTII